MTPTQLLAFEHAHPHNGPTKNAAIRHQLGISDIRYHQLLNKAARTTEGIQAHPVTARIIRDRAQARALRREARVARLDGEKSVRSVA